MIFEKKNACYINKSHIEESYTRKLTNEQKLLSLESKKLTEASTSVLHIFDIRDYIFLALDIKNAASKIKSLFENLDTPTFDRRAKNLNWARNPNSKDQLRKKLQLILYKVGRRGQLFFHKNGKTLIYKQIINTYDKIKPLIKKTSKEFVLKGGKILKSAQNTLKVLTKGNTLAIITHSSFAINDLVNNDQKTFGRIFGEFSSEMIKLLINAKLATLLVAGAAGGATKLGLGATAAFIGAGASGVLILVGVGILVGYTLQSLDKEYNLTDKLCKLIDSGIEGVIRLKEEMNRESVSALAEFERQFLYWATGGRWY